MGLIRKPNYSEMKLVGEQHARKRFTKHTQCFTSTMITTRPFLMRSVEADATSIGWAMAVNQKPYNASKVVTQ